ncbi:2-dehydro-3-deoxygalactonokinase [Litoreibacter roseus]|uniref:2-keto-3-deoxy-galactonokinase n=1 Tax=Litoreibacter roseus TaxID=2601869 RepID=A0A6N6J9L8_9RHOB|nr:2-dehydro-3-deoxygalactonokinase [Litoreibacter roseus]GFE62953.1 2-keto-3-deoxy-galactonokinase [Litoreibacter roseus]
MSGRASYADWIAVDWGTSNLRVWAMTGRGEVRDQRMSDQGMSKLSQAEFEPVLLNLIEPWLGTAPTPVVCCGMVGSRQGWREAPYAAVPTAPLGGAQDVPCSDGRIKVSLLPGLKQQNAPDVMRGEETQIAGFLATHPKFDGVLCLPGTHTKWVHISAGEVVSFQTLMTGELFDLLGRQSVLRHSVDTEDWDKAAFSEAVSDTLSRPEALAARLFQIRARDLLEGTHAGIARARLSGFLLGVELAATKPYWLGQNIALVGATALTALYASALSVQGLVAQVEDGDTMTLKGLTAAYTELYG